MKKNKKGFTLIELLAVIVILGIIITIVVSNVVKYISQAKQGSYKDAVSVFVKNVQTQLLANQVSSDTSTIENCDDGGTVKDAKGKSIYCYGLYDYDKTNMKIKISTTGIKNVIIEGQNGFASVDMSDTKYCPKYTDAECTKTGTIKFTMDSNGSVN